MKIINWLKNLFDASDILDIIMGPLTIRITVAFGCFMLLMLLAFFCFMLFICNYNRDMVVARDIQTRKNSANTTSWKVILTFNFTQCRTNVMKFRLNWYSFIILVKYYIYQILCRSSSEAILTKTTWWRTTASIAQRYLN